jgi:hypothetical protein
MTVSCRRSARTGAAGAAAPAPGKAEDGVASARSAAAASSSRRRWPTEVTPNFPQILGRQSGEQVGIDVMVAKRLLVPLQAQCA